MENTLINSNKVLTCSIFCCWFYSLNSFSKLHRWVTFSLFLLSEIISYICHTVWILPRSVWGLLKSYRLCVAIFSYGHLIYTALSFQINILTTIFLTGNFCTILTWDLSKVQISSLMWRILIWLLCNMLCKSFNTK